MAENDVNIAMTLDTRQFNSQYTAVQQKLKENQEFLKTTNQLIKRGATSAFALNKKAIKEYGATYKEVHEKIIIATSKRIANIEKTSLANSKKKIAAIKTEMSIHKKDLIIHKNKVKQLKAEDKYVGKKKEDLKNLIAISEKEMAANKVKLIDELNMYKKITRILGKLRAKKREHAQETVAIAKETNKKILNAEHKKTNQSIKNAKKELDKKAKMQRSWANKIKGAMRPLSDISSVFRGFMAGAYVVISAFRKIGQAVTYALDKYTELQKGILLSSTLINDAVLTQIGGMDRLRSMSKDMAAQFGSSFETVTSAMYKALTSGADPKYLEAIMTIGNKLAVGGKANFDVVVDGITSLVNAFQDLTYEEESITRVSDAMFIAMKYGKFTLEELANNVGKITTAAANMNMSMEESIASLAALTTTGLHTEEATTQLRAALKNLLDPAESAKKLMNQLGISYGQGALEGGTLVEKLVTMRKVLKQNGYELQDVFKNVRGLQGALALTANVNEKYNTIMMEMGTITDSLGLTTERAYNRMADSLDILDKRAKAAWVNMAENVGKALAPMKRAWDKMMIKMFEESTTKYKLAAEQLQLTASAYRTLIALFGERAEFITKEEIMDVTEFNKKLEIMRKISPELAKEFYYIAEAIREGKLEVKDMHQHVIGILKKFKAMHLEELGEFVKLVPEEAGIKAKIEDIKTTEQMIKSYKMLVTVLKEYKKGSPLEFKGVKGITSEFEYFFDLIRLNAIEVPPMYKEAVKNIRAELKELGISSRDMALLSVETLDFFQKKLKGGFGIALEGVDFDTGVGNFIHSLSLSLDAHKGELEVAYKEINDLIATQIVEKGAEAHIDKILKMMSITSSKAWKYLSDIYKETQVRFLVANRVINETLSSTALDTSDKLKYLDKELSELFKKGNVYTEDYVDKMTSLILMKKAELSLEEENVKELKDRAKILNDLVLNYQRLLTAQAKPAVGEVKAAGVEAEEIKIKVGIDESIIQETEDTVNAITSIFDELGISHEDLNLSGLEYLDISEDLLQLINNRVAGLKAENDALNEILITETERERVHRLIKEAKAGIAQEEEDAMADSLIHLGKIRKEIGILEDKFNMVKRVNEDLVDMETLQIQMDVDPEFAALVGLYREMDDILRNIRDKHGDIVDRIDEQVVGLDSLGQEAYRSMMDSMVELGEEGDALADRQMEQYDRVVDHLIESDEYTMSEKAHILDKYMKYLKDEAKKAEAINAEVATEYAKGVMDMKIDLERIIIQEVYNEALVQEALGNLINDQNILLKDKIRTLKELLETLRTGLLGIEKTLESERARLFELKKEQALKVVGLVLMANVNIINAIEKLKEEAKGLKYEKYITELLDEYKGQVESISASMLIAIQRGDIKEYEILSTRLKNVRLLIAELVSEELSDTVEDISELNDLTAGIDINVKGVVNGLDSLAGTQNDIKNTNATIESLGISALNTEAKIRDTEDALASLSGEAHLLPLEDIIKVGEGVTKDMSIDIKAELNFDWYLHSDTWLNLKSLTDEMIKYVQAFTTKYLKDKMALDMGGLRLQWEVLDIEFGAKIATWEAKFKSVAEGNLKQLQNKQEQLKKDIAQLNKRKEEGGLTQDELKKINDQLIYAGTLQTKITTDISFWEQDWLKIIEEHGVTSAEFTEALARWVESGGIIPEGFGDLMDIYEMLDKHRKLLEENLKAKALQQLETKMSDIIEGLKISPLYKIGEGTMVSAYVDHMEKELDRLNGIVSRAVDTGSYEILHNFETFADTLGRIMGDIYKSEEATFKERNEAIEIYVNNLIDYGMRWDEIADKLGDIKGPEYVEYGADGAGVQTGVLQEIRDQYLDALYERSDMYAGYVNDMRKMDLDYAKKKKQMERDYGEDWLEEEIEINGEMYNMKDLMDEEYQARRLEREVQYRKEVIQASIDFQKGYRDVMISYYEELDRPLTDIEKEILKGFKVEQILDDVMASIQPILEAGEKVMGAINQDIMKKFLEQAGLTEDQITEILLEATSWDGVIAMSTVMVENAIGNIKGIMSGIEGLTEEAKNAILDTSITWDKVLKELPSDLDDETIKALKESREGIISAQNVLASISGLNQDVIKVLMDNTTTWDDVLAVLPEGLDPETLEYLKAKKDELTKYYNQYVQLIKLKEDEAKREQALYDQKVEEGDPEDINIVEDLWLLKQKIRFAEAEILGVKKDKVRWAQFELEEAKKYLNYLQQTSKIAAIKKGYGIDLDVTSLSDLESHLAYINELMMGADKDFLEELLKYKEAILAVIDARHNLKDAMIEELDVQAELNQMKLHGFAEYMKAIQNVTDKSEAFRKVDIMHSINKRKAEIARLRAKEELTDEEKEWLQTLNEGTMATEKDWLTALNNIKDSYMEFSAAIVSTISDISSAWDEEGAFDAAKFMDAIKPITDSLVKGIGNAFMQGFGDALVAAGDIVVEAIKAISSLIFNIINREIFEKRDLAQLALEETELYYDRINQKVEHRNKLLEMAKNLNLAILNTLEEQIEFQKDTLRMLGQELGIDAEVFLSGDPEAMGQAAKDMFEDYAKVLSQIDDLNVKIYNLTKMLNALKIDIADDNWLEEIGQEIAGWFKMSKEDRINLIQAQIDAAVAERDALLETAESYEEYLEMWYAIQKAMRDNIEQIWGFNQQIANIYGDQALAISSQLLMYEDLLANAELLGLTEQDRIDMLLKEAGLIQQHLNLLDDRFTKEQQIAIKKAQLAGYSDVELNRLRLQAVDDLIAAKENELSLAEEYGYGEDYILGLEEDLVDLMLQKLGLQQALNGELGRTNVLYDEQLRRFLRVVIEARKVGDIESEHRGLLLAAQRLLQLGLSAEEIYDMLGVSIEELGLAPTSGLEGDVDINLPNVDELIDDQTEHYETIEDIMNSVKDSDLIHYESMEELTANGNDILSNIYGFLLDEFGYGPETEEEYDLEHGDEDSTTEGPEEEEELEYIPELHEPEIPDFEGLYSPPEMKSASYGSNMFNSGGFYDVSPQPIIIDSRSRDELNEMKKQNDLIQDEIELLDDIKKGVSENKKVIVNLKEYKDMKKNQSEMHRFLNQYESDIRQ